MNKKLALVLGVFIMLSLNGMAPAGIKNIGNNCFMNAPLQCLAALDDLTHLVSNYAAFYRPQSFSALYCNFLRRSRVEVFNPEELCRRGWEIMGKAPLTPHDADEFLTQFLGNLTDKDLQEGAREVGQNSAQLFGASVSSCVSYEPDHFISLK